MQSTPLTKHQTCGSVAFLLLFFVAFLWGVQGFVLATTTSTESTASSTTVAPLPPSITYSGSAIFQYGDAGGSIENNTLLSQKVINLRNTGSNADTFRTTLPINPETRCGLKSGNASSYPSNVMPNTLPASVDVPLALNETKYIVAVCITKGLSAGSFTWGFKTVSVGALGAGSTEIITEQYDTVNVTEPILCNDSDGGTNTGVKGTATGTYAGAVTSYIAIYGQEPNPTTPKSTTEKYSTYIDHCANSTQLNEGFCDTSGRLQAIGISCANGCNNGVCVTPPAETPGAGAPEPSNNDAGVWAQVEVATGQVVGSAICTKSVCGINGEWHGYVPPASYQTGSVWWPTSKRYIWQLPGQAGYGSGTFNFQTYVFTVSAGTIYNGVLTPVSPPPPPPPPSSSPTSTTSTTTPPPLSVSSLVGHWKFDGNGNNEVAGGSSALTVGNASFKSSGGKLDGYVYIPGSSDWAKIPYNSAYDLPDSFTVEFWFRQRSNQSFNQNLIYKGTAPNNYNFNVSRWLWNQYNYGPVIAGHTAANTGFWTQPSNPNQLAHNAWHHVVFTKSPNYHAYYLDGALTGSKDITSSYNTEYGGPAKTPHNDIIIGDTAVDTDIDNLKIYNRALSASEVAENGGFPQTSPSPVPSPTPPPPSPTTTSTPTSLLPSALSPFPTSTQILPYQLVPLITSTPLIFIPATTSAPLLPSPFLEVMCADGSRVPSGASCSALVVFICANGEKVRSPNECIPSKPPEDAITLCVNHGGMWCADRCAPRGSICGGVIENGVAKVIDPAHVKEFEAQKRELIREIRLAERALRQAKQNPDVAEASLLKDKLEEVKLHESKDALGELAVLQQAAKSLNEKAEEARERRLQEPGAAEADHRTQEQNLRKIKQQIRPFERHLAILESRVKGFEKAGIAVDPALKEAVTSARGIAQKIKIAKNYDAADETVEDMLDVATTLNDFIPYIESAARLSQAVKLLEQQVVRADRALQETVKLAKRLKIDSSEDIAEMRALLEQAKVAVAAVKTGGIDKELLFDYSETQVLDAVAEVVEIADHFRVISNVRRHVTKVTSDLKQYDSRIRREERKKKDMTNARALVAEAKENVAGLQKLVSSRLTVENADAMLELMRGINDVKEELDELLGVAKPSAVERDLERVIQSGGEKVKSYNLDTVEKLII